MTFKVRKALFPVAGMGTRFLPATKANPKEMMPIVDKPLIQFAVEEAIAAGITELIFVTSSSKRAIEDHFDSHFELEARLASKQQYELLDLVRNVLPAGISCVYIRQPEPLGLGHAVLCARSVIGDEPFAVLLADDLIDDRGGALPSPELEPRPGTQAPCLQSMVQHATATQSSVIAVEAIDVQQCSQYGIVGFQPTAAAGSNTAHEILPGRLHAIHQIVEKPKPENAPSHWAVLGRYVLTPKIFELLETLPRGIQSEIQLTDALSQLLQHESVYAYPFLGKRYDCGSKLGYLQAIVEYALRHPTVGHAFKAYLDTVMAEET